MQTAIAPQNLPHIMPPSHGLRDAIAHLLTPKIQEFVTPINPENLNHLFYDLNQFVDVLLPTKKRYAPERAIVDVLWTAYDRAIQYLTGQPERQCWLNTAAAWAKYRQVPGQIDIAVRDAVVRSASTSPSISKPVEVRPPATQSAPVFAQPSPVPVLEPATPAPIQKGADAGSISFPSIKLDRTDQAEFDQALTWLGQAIAGVYQSELLGHRQVRYVGHSDVPLRVIKLFFEAGPKEIVEFDKLIDNQKIRNAITALIPGFRQQHGIQFEMAGGGSFEVIIPLPESSWGSIDYLEEFIPVNEKGNHYFPERDALSPISMRVGKLLDGSTIDQPLKRNVVVSGAPESGKSNFFQVASIDLLMHYTDRLLCLIAIDPRRKTLADLDGLSHLWNGKVISDGDTALVALEMALAEIDWRDKEFAGQGVQDIYQYNKAVAKDKILPFWVILIDELDALMESVEERYEPEEYKEWCDRFFAILARILRKGRANGVHAVLSAHTPSQKSLPMEIRNLCVSRWVMQCAANAAEHTTGVKDNWFAVGKGDIWLSEFGHEKRRGLIAFIQPDHLKSLVRYLKQKSPNAKPRITSSFSRSTVAKSNKPGELVIESPWNEPEPVDVDRLRWDRLCELRQKKVPEDHILIELTGCRFYANDTLNSGTPQHIDQEKFAAWQAGIWERIENLARVPQSDPRRRAIAKAKATSQKAIATLEQIAQQRGWS
jgi:hypothetical protein